MLVPRRALREKENESAYSRTSGSHQAGTGAFRAEPSSVGRSENSFENGIGGCTGKNRKGPRDASRNHKGGSEGKAEGCARAAARTPGEIPHARATHEMGCRSNEGKILPRRRFPLALLRRSAGGRRPAHLSPHICRIFRPPRRTRG